MRHVLTVKKNKKLGNSVIAISFVVYQPKIPWEVCNTCTKRTVELNSFMQWLFNPQVFLTQACLAGVRHITVVCCARLSSSRCAIALGKQVHRETIP